MVAVRAHDARRESGPSTQACARARGSAGASRMETRTATAMRDQMSRPTPAVSAFAVKARTAAATRRVVVSVHDLAGREVARLVDEPLVTGEHQAAWDGRDRAGHAVASGVYLAVMFVDGIRQHTQKLALVR